MSAVGTGVLAKLQKRLPNQIGTNRQWTTEYISALTLMAAHAAEERIGMTWVYQEISLSDSVATYDIDSKFIEVSTVEFALDGATYDRELKACSFNDLDRMSESWRDDTGIYPSRYTLMCTPGTQDPAGSHLGGRIIIWRMLADAGSAKIKVSGYGIGTASTNVPDDVQERVHVPYILSILMADKDEQEASWYYRKFKEACDDIKSRFVSQYTSQPTRLGVID